MIALSWATAIFLALVVSYFQEFCVVDRLFLCSIDIFKGNTEILLTVFGGSIVTAVLPLLVFFKSSSSSNTSGNSKLSSRSTSTASFQKLTAIHETLIASYRSAPSELSTIGNRYDDIVTVDVFDKRNKLSRSLRNQRRALKKIFRIALCYVVSW